MNGYKATKTIANWYVLESPEGKSLSFAYPEEKPIQFCANVLNSETQRLREELAAKDAEIKELKALLDPEVTRERPTLGSLAAKIPPRKFQVGNKVMAHDLFDGEVKAHALINFEWFYAVQHETNMRIWEEDALSLDVEE